MSKQAAPRRVADNEALATGTMIKGSAQKLNLVAQLIRGRKVEDALNVLTFSKKAMAVDVRKVLASAIANAENNHNLDVDSLIVAEASVGKSISRISSSALFRLREVCSAIDCAESLSLAIRAARMPGSVAKTRTWLSN